MLGDCSLFSCLFRIKWLLVFINFDNLLEIGVAVGKSMAKEWFLAIHEWLHLVLRLILLWEWPICILRNNVNIFSSWGLSFSIIIWGTFLESWLSARRFYFSYFLGALRLGDSLAPLYLTEFFPLFINLTGALFSNCFIGNPPGWTKLVKFSSGPWTDWDTTTLEFRN